MSRTLSRVGMVFAGALLSSCANRLRTPYVRPAVPPPAAWADTAETEGAITQWWRVLGDSRVEELVDRVLVNNNDLAAVSSCVRRAGLDARIGQIPLRPRPAGSISGSYTA